MDYTIKIKKYTWWWLLLLLLLVTLFFLLKNCNKGNDILPAKPGKIIPIDTTKIVNDPDTVKNIVSDRLNIALTGDNKDINAFARRFKEEYPGKYYQIIYYDTVVVRLQIQIPADEREKIKDELKSKMPEFEMLIWYEGIFKRDYTPRDPGFSNLKKKWYHEKVKALDAWDITRGDSNLVIAVIDDGFDLSHPEFKGKIYKPWNVPSGTPTVTTGKKLIHGTHVAGIAIGLENNGQGVAGIAPNCKFMPIQVGDYNGIMNTTSVIDGVLYAIQNDADIVNMSLGMGIPPNVERMPIKEQREAIRMLFKDEEEFWNELFKIAYDKNIIFVLAAGNTNVMIGLDPMQRSEYTIKVSATKPDDSKAVFSNFGSKSTISAPGVHIYSCLPQNKYDYLDGTSMAAPVVSGGIALIKTVNPALSFDQIIDLLQSTGIPVNSPKQYIGNIIQLNRAVGVAENNRKRMPRVECPDLQNKIDSLLREIEKIKKLCPDSTIADTMRIPENPENYDFAVGRWKSTTHIYNNEGEKVVIYFDFISDGTGVITLVEPDNTKCSGNLNLSLNKNIFIIDQTFPASCNPPSKGYNKYYFECKPDKTGCAECWAQNKTNKKNKFDFKLVKI